MELNDTTAHGEVLESAFTLRRDGRDVPGLLWRSPAGAGPLVLIGHGGSASSSEGYVVALGRHLARDLGCHAVAIDGPVHGGRRGERSQDSTLVLMDFMQAWSSDDTMTDEMVADWRHVLDAVHDELGIADEPVGYWGLSMGTILGLPLVAAEPRISAAVLGLCGTTGPTGDRLAADAAAVTCPTMFLMKWEDELFSHDAVLDLFGRLATEDRTLVATPGSHGAVWPETFAQTAQFLAGRLRGTSGPDRA
jgi:pimeloyl-ACP methyl ester carboxylesterase